MTMSYTSIQIYITCSLIITLITVMYLLNNRHNHNREFYSELNTNPNFLINCNFNKINSIPGDVKSTKTYAFVNEISNKEFLSMLLPNILSELNGLDKYIHQNTDKYFHKKIGFYTQQMFDKWMQSISYTLKDFRVVKLNINMLKQPSKHKTSRDYLIDFDVVIHRKYKNHGKHVNVKAEIANIKSLSSLLFDFHIYHIEILGYVFEDKIKIMYENNIHGYDSYTEFQKL